MKVILGSSSPRRRDILNKVGIPHEVVVSNCEETYTSKVPCDIVKELADLKALDVASIVKGQDVLIIAADTLVAKDDKVLGKPRDKEDAFSMLSMLSAGVHQVYTGVSVIYGEIHLNFYEETLVEFDEMSDEDILEYIETGEPMDKAGAYAIQGICSKYIKGIKGDYNNVVGLPICRIISELRRYGIKM